MVISSLIWIALGLSVIELYNIIFFLCQSYNTANLQAWIKKLTFPFFDFFFFTIKVRDVEYVPWNEDVLTTIQLLLVFNGRILTATQIFSCMLKCLGEIAVQDLFKLNRCLSVSLFAFLWISYALFFFFKVFLYVWFVFWLPW